MGRKCVIRHMRTAKAQIGPTQSDQGIHCPLTESMDTTECMERKGPDFIVRMRRMI